MAVSRKWVLVAGCLVLGACGQTTAQQALVGGVAGAFGGLVVGGNAMAGAVIGATANVIYCDENPGACRAF